MHPPPVPPSGSYLCFPCAFGYFLARTLVISLGGNEKPRVRTVPNFAPKIILPSAAASASEHSGASASLATALRSRRSRRRVCRRATPVNRSAASSSSKSSIKYVNASSSRRASPSSPRMRQAIDRRHYLLWAFSFSISPLDRGPGEERPRR